MANKPKTKRKSGTKKTGGTTECSGFSLPITAKQHARLEAVAKAGNVRGGAKALVQRQLKAIAG